MSRELTPQNALVAGGLLVLGSGGVAVAAGVVDSVDPFMWAFIGAVFAGITVDEPGGRIPTLPRTGMVLVGGILIGVGQVFPADQQVQTGVKLVGALAYVAATMDYVSVLGTEG